MMATHPPLEARIKALDPNWVPSADQGKTISSSQSAPGASGFAGGAAGAAVSQLSGSANLPAAQRMIETADANLNQASHDTFEARAMVYAMLLSHDDAVRGNQIQLIAQLAEPGVPELVPNMYRQLSDQDHQHKLLHLEQAMPTLKEMSRAQYQRFYDLTAKLIVADKAVDIFEWVVHRMITQELYAHFVKPHRSNGRITRTGKVAKQAGLILSLLATVGADNGDDQVSAYQRGQKTWGGSAPITRLKYFDHQALNQALERLRELNADLKQRFIDACSEVVNADGKLTSQEFALIKGIAVTLGCPLPPVD